MAHGQTSGLVMVRLLLAAALAVAGCGRRAAERVPDERRAYPPAYGDTLVQGTLADPVILNPVLASDSASFSVTGLIFNGLLRYDQDLNFEGELARSWEISADGRVITFHLRSGIRWQDGARLTARDVQFTYETYIDPRVKTAYRSNYTSIARAAALDELTWRVWYREPFGPALDKLAAMSILPEHLLRGRDVNTADDFNTHPVGSGPYRFVSWRRAETISLQANPEYFEGRPRLDRVIFRVIPDMAVQFMELQSGGLDAADLTPDQFNREGNQTAFLSRFRKYRYPAPQYTYLGFNLDNPLFRDLRIRRAIALAIDRGALVKSVLENLGQVANGPYPPSSWVYDDTLKPLPYAPDEARRLLVSAGCRYAADGSLWLGDRPFAFTLLTNQGNQNREQTATIIQSQLKQVGIQVNIRIIAWSTLLGEFINKRKFDALVMGWSLGFDPDLYDIWHSSKTGEFEFNFVSYRNRSVDRLLEQGRRTLDRQERIRIYGEMQRLIAADLPYVFLYVPDSLVAVHRRVLGIRPAKAGIGYNFIKWYVPKEFQKYRE